MKLIIDIDENIYHRFVNGFANDGDAYLIEQLFKNGTPLPKEHGRLKDIDEVERLLDLDKPNNAIAKALKNIIESVPTIIEADTDKSPCDNCIWFECEEYGKICPFYGEKTEEKEGDEE